MSVDAGAGAGNGALDTPAATTDSNETTTVAAGLAVPVPGDGAYTYNAVAPATPVDGAATTQAPVTYPVQMDYVIPSAGNLNAEIPYKVNINYNFDPNNPSTTLPAPATLPPTTDANGLVRGHLGKLCCVDLCEYRVSTF